MDKKLLWIEKYLTDEELNHVLSMLMTLTESGLKELEHTIDLEKRDIKSRDAGLPRKLASQIAILLSMSEGVLDRFQEHGFLSVDLMTQRRQKIQHSKDKVLEITIRENSSKEVFHES